MFISQLSVYLQNDKGTLRTLTKTLAENKIDMLALSIADTTNFGIIRIVVKEEDIEKAKNVLTEKGIAVKVNHVLCVAVPNQPSGLDGVLAIIEENGICIDYMYSLNNIVGNKALLVFRLSAEGMDKTQIATLLASKGVILLQQSDINRL